MAKFGDFDYSEFSEFVKILEKKASKSDMQKIMTECMSKAIKMVLAGAKNDSPVQTGAMRRAWTSTPIRRSGNKISADVFNPLQYAPHIEYGHRKRGGGFVKGQFMMTNTVNRVEQQYQKLLEKAIAEHFGDLFD